MTVCHFQHRKNSVGHLFHRPNALTLLCTFTKLKQTILLYSLDLR
jgi:hypothetical protein